MIEKEAKSWPSVPFPGWRAYGTDEDGPCRCGATEGQVHNEGCDIEECGRCGNQRITCGCDEVLIAMVEALCAFCDVTVNAGAIINSSRVSGMIAWPPLEVPADHRE